MDLRKLKTLIDLVSESNVSELEITEADGKVRIVKAGAAPIVMQTVAAPAVAMPAAAAVSKLFPYTRRSSIDRNWPYVGAALAEPARAQTMQAPAISL